MCALHYQQSHLSSQPTNLQAAKKGLGRSEPDIASYSRMLERRSTAILDIFNESPRPPAAPISQNRNYKQFDNGEKEDMEAFKKSFASQSLQLSSSQESLKSEEKFKYATKKHQLNHKSAPQRLSAKLSTVGQNLWRQKRRKSGVVFDSPTFSRTLDEGQDPNSESSNDADRNQLLKPPAKKDYFASHEQLFEQTSERKRRFWEFMKSREQIVQYDVFVSYNHDSKPFALNLYKMLKHGFKYAVFIDKQLSSKQKLNSALDDALRNTKVMVCVVTEKYAKSRACCAEVSLANNLGVPMIPLVVEDLPPHKLNPKNFWPPEGEMSLPLAPLLYIDFRQYEDEAAVSSKTKELKKRIDAVLKTSI